MKTTKRMGERNVKRALTKKNERQKTMGWMVYGMMFGWLSVNMDRVVQSLLQATF